MGQRFESLSYRKNVGKLNFPTTLSFSIEYFQQENPIHYGKVTDYI